MKHYLVSLWNVDCYDLGWLERRAKVFEKYCLPSVVGQSNKNFEWLLISDSRTPDKFRDVLDAYPAKVYYHDFEHHDWMVKESDLGTVFTDKMRFSIRIETVGDVVAVAIGKQNTDYIITSRLDNDDMIATDHIERIEMYTKDALTRRTNESFWVSLVRGYRYKVDEGKMYPFNSRNNSFLSFVESPNDLKTCYQCVHTVAATSGYDTEIIRSGAPTWAEVIHGENVLNRVKRLKGETSAQPILGRFSL